jgi:hypothetical protein
MANTSDAAIQLVFLVWYLLRPKEDPDDALLVGVYRSKEEASAAVERRRRDPGFREEPDQFLIVAYPVGIDHWVGGFSKG